MALSSQLQAHAPAALPAAEAWVGKGSHLKRISMHGRGRSGRRLRYRSHLTVRGGEGACWECLMGLPAGVPAVRVVQAPMVLTCASLAAARQPGWHVSRQLAPVDRSVRLHGVLLPAA